MYLHIRSKMNAIGRKEIQWQDYDKSSWQISLGAQVRVKACQRLFCRCVESDGPTTSCASACGILNMLSLGSCTFLRITSSATLTYAGFNPAGRSPQFERIEQGKNWAGKEIWIVVEAMLMLLKLWGHIACWKRPIELRQCIVYFPNSMTWCCSLDFISLETLICKNINKRDVSKVSWDLNCIMTSSDVLGLAWLLHLAKAFLH